MPNYSENQKTGDLAEQEVQHLFSSWGWNTGKDRIDMGYDLFVCPDEDKFKGARFLVQVKGTVKSKSRGTVTATVSKTRLLQYAVNVHPVFIVRVTPDGIYWRHAQEWVLLHESRLSGSGESGVKIDKANDLKDRQAFEAYLASAFQTSPTLGKPVSDLEREVGFLNSLDPKVGVRLLQTGNGRRYGFYPKEEDFDAKFSFQVVNTGQNTSNLRDAIHFGIPRQVEAVNIKMSGSPVFEHVTNGFDKGTLTIGTQPEKRGCVRLFAGNKHSVSTSALPLDVEIYRGRSGLAMTNEKLDSLFSLTIKFELRETEVNVNVTPALRDKKIATQPIREFDALRPLTDWVDQVLVRKALLFEADFKPAKLPIVAHDENLEVFMPMLRWFRTVSRLHLIAQQLNSDFVLPENVALSGEELNDIHLFYALLKGDRRPIRLGDIVTNTTVKAEQIAGNILVMTTILSLDILGQQIGVIPVMVQCSGLHIEQLSEPEGIRISMTEDSEAWLSFDDNCDGING